MSDGAMELNETQREVAEFEGGVALVLAGAGSGKTKTLVARVARLLERGVHPSNICAMTFTNKAAREMMERVNIVLDEHYYFPWFGTFHSVCVRLLRQEYAAAGLMKSFKIFDEGDAVMAVKKILRNGDFEIGKLSPRGILAKISRAKNDFLTIPEFASGLPYYQRDLAEIWREYEKNLEEAGAVDFDDLLVKSVEMLTKNPEVLARLREQFQHILVDEYQDTNTVQYKLVKLLYGVEDGKRSLCVVGDDWQSIYSWRGADFRNILRFEQDYKNARVIKLQKNYRSTQEILDAADRIIKSSAQRSNKIMHATRGVGEKVIIKDLLDDREEARFVVNHLMRPYKNSAVLYRTNAQSLPFEQALSAAGIAYKIYGGQRFFDRKEIKDIIGFVRLLFDGFDEFALHRVINIPSRGMGDASIRKLDVFARANFDNYVDAFLGAFMSDLSKRAVAELTKLGSALQPIREMLANEAAPAEILRKIVVASEYYDFLDDGTDPEGSRRANLEAFINDAESYASMDDFLASTMLASSSDEDDPSDDFVILSSIHAAKGLEFETVFVVGMEEGLLPMRRADATEDDLEEEIRLAYVAMTRAKDNLYLLWARRRQMYGKIKQNDRSYFLDLVEGKEKEELGYEPCDFGW
ncbi:MAG: UvrD-helicase domain-containing protein [Candidatus Nomurabacteria bacterium]|jgi:DNA helicase-2/ATP-dependent DNA helicase PcrA|nr:UvrD-helicase domain-containing protein [Candidatus Nomurabacteria bacterium]